MRLLALSLWGAWAWNDHGPLSGQLLRREGDANANASAPVFVHVPKTAGTSIWEALGPTYSDSGRYPEVPFACMKHNPPQRHVAHSFAIVREPCERLASEFTWGRKLAWFDVYYKMYGVVKEFPPSCQMFNGWVRAVLARFEESSDVEDCHMIPQSCYLSKVDRVLPLDSQLQRNLRLLSPRFARLELKRLNADDLARRSNVSCACLDGATLTKVQRHFQDDFGAWEKVSGKASPFAPAASATRSSCSFKKNGKQIWPPAVEVHASGAVR